MNKLAIGIGNLNKDDPTVYIPDIDNSTPEQTQIGTISEIAAIGINIFMGITTTVILISIIVAGIKFVTSRGDPKALMEARQSLLYAIVALFILLLLFNIKLIILNVFGAGGTPFTNVLPGF